MYINYLELEKKFINEQFNYIKGFVIKEGVSPIMITAPHSVNHFRNSKIKQGEYRTGVIAEIIYMNTDCNVAIKTKNLNDDANYDENSIFKEDVEKNVKNRKIKLLIDIHIASPKREFDVDIGTGYGENICNNKRILNLINKEMSKNYSEIVVDHTFPAKHRFTVAAYISRTCNIPAIQLEINWRCIDTEEKLKYIITVLTKIIKKLELEI